MIKFKGVIPALSTPLCEDESINVSELYKLIDYLSGKGADGFYIGGATGEGFALRTEERMILAEESVKAINKKVPAIVQIAAADFKDTLLLAKHAEECGADAISATAPVFFKYDRDDVYNYYKRIAESVHIPVMIYYSPLAKFDFDAEYAARLFEIDNITAIKWTSSNYYEVIKLLDRTNGDINVINGPDEMLLMGLSAGCDGGIGTTYNFMLETIRGVYDSFVNNNMPRALEYQSKADRIIGVMHKYMGIPVCKLLLSQMGFDVGEAAFPMKRYSSEQKAKIIDEMRCAGLEI